MQKKWLIIPTAIIGLGIIWTGIAWYTGSKIEKDYNSYIENINNKQLFSIKTVKLERHIFSTDIELQVISDKDIFPFKSTIYHGPFPINQLKQFNLIPTLASSYTVLKETEERAKLFENFENKTPLALTLSVGYQKQIDADLLINKGKVEEEKFSGNWEQSHSVFSSDNKGAIKGALTIPKLALKIVDKHSSTDITVDQYKLDVDLQLTDWEYLPTGTIRAFAKESGFTLYEKDQPVSTWFYKNAKSELKLIKQENFYSLQTTSGQDITLTTPDTDFGTIQENIVLELNHWHGDSLMQLIKASRNKDKEAITQALQTLFNKQPQLLIKPFTWSNEQGQAKLTATIIPIENLSSKISTLTGKDNIFEQLNLDVTLDKSFINSLINRFPEPQKQMVQELVEEKIKSLLDQQAFTETDKDYQLRLEYKDSDVYLNQQKIPKDILLFVLLSLVADFN